MPVCVCCVCVWDRGWWGSSPPLIIHPREAGWGRLLCSPHMLLEGNREPWSLQGCPGVYGRGQHLLCLVTPESICQQGGTGLLLLFPHFGGTLPAALSWDSRPRPASYWCHFLPCVAFAPLLSSLLPSCHQGLTGPLLPAFSVITKSSNVQL